MKQMLKKTLFQILALMILATANSYSSFALPKQEIQIEPGIYVLVSFAINDESLRSYFNEANHYGAKLVMRGLVGKKFGRNRFAETKTKLEKVGINIDINPNLFKQFGIKQVPAGKRQKHMRIFNIISILTLITISASNAVFASSVGAAFNQREKFKNVTILGNPDEAKTFIKKDGDVSNIGSLNDASLTGEGNNVLRSSELGEFLQHSELKKMDAINQHKINPDNSLLKKSLKIEQNPMAKTGGGSLSASETSTTSFVNKSCVEGVDFNVDVGLELVLEAEEQEEIIRKPQTSIEIPYKDVPDSWWQKSYYSEAYRGYVHHFLPHYTLFNNEATHRLLPESIVLPPQNIVVDLIHPQNATSIALTAHHTYRGFRIKSALVRFHYSVEERRKKFVQTKEYWQVATAPAEKLVEENECYETSRVCTRKGIKKFFGKYDITRPCWSEKISYQCTSKPKDGCAHLTKENCRLVDSECEHRIGSICLRWKRNFTCPITKKEMNYSLSDSSIYCLGGNCHSPTIEENQDFGNVAYLAAINEAQKDCDKESSGICKNPIMVFAGEANGCDKAIVGFINCCSANKGWGKDIKLSSCSPE
ncbi:MAG: hypothetical protein EBY20_08210, partial [Alphaproteobacteria bacterium]|nr:hypothetical protein [Alphaproteobacteria bacterium]